MTYSNAASNLLLDSADITPQATYSDPLLTYFWYLLGVTGSTKGANVEKIWDDYRGTGVLVGVIDDGIDYTHPDLAANYAFNFGYDSRDGDLDAYPSDPADRHGTTVAGVIAAALDNGVGGAGVAPGASIAGYRIGFGDNGTDAQILGAFQWMAGVDVANNSWGFDGYLGDNFLSSEYASIGDALSDALWTGRGGLGTIVVFAAGNGRASGQDVNYHNFQNSRGIIAAAATDNGGNVTWFSTPGAALLVAAPGQDIVTTDRVGAAGYSSDDYASMSGTSFSSPIVSGVAALMLDANAGLGWRDVQAILAATAVQTGGSAGWTFNDATNWNGGAMHASYDYGFGLVDAYAAVRVAESWRLASTSANEWVASSGLMSPHAAIPDGGSVSRSVTLPQGLRVQHVEVDISLAHTNIGQLQITLTAPDGTQSLLFHNPATTDDNIVFTFSTTRDWGELSGGNWTLTVSDTQLGETGTLVQWALRAYGDLAGDDTYVYTDEFAALAAADPARHLLSDSGGNDNINTAAIASDTLLDLRPGQVSSIAGQAVTISAATLIENADSGDGNDILIGNDAANSLRGWRGDDFLDGGMGADTLVGGVGDDSYVVESTGDVVVEAAGSGIDTVRTTLTYYLIGSDVENLAYLGSGNFVGTGNALVNVISGGSGNDSIDGRVGADTLGGGAGDDTYYVDNLGDSVVEQVGEGNDIIYSSVSWTLGANLENVYLTGAAAIGATGNGLGNTLYGHANSAANILAGSFGDDIYYVGAGDTVVELTGEGTDSVYTYANHSLEANVENLYLNLSTAATLTGNELGNILRGNIGNDTLLGLAGNDTLIGLAGNDTLNGGLGADTLTGGTGDDTYYVDNVGDSVVELAGEGNDTIYSSVSWTLGVGAENLSLTGAAAISATGNDLGNALYGSGNSAANILTGGLGNDTYYGGAGDTVVELAGEGNDIIYSGVGWTLGANLESLYLTGSAAVSATGNDLGNALYGNGNSAANILTGGLGNDTYYAGAGDTVVELAGEGNDIIYSNVGGALGANMESLYLTGTAAVSATGNDLGNALYGNGNSAANILTGGLGNDTYYSGAGDTAVELAAEGNDIIYTDVTWTLGANLESLYLTGAAAVSATGNELANTLYGNANSAANTLAGGLGNDVYYAGAGDTVVELATEGTDSVYCSADHTLQANVENLYLNVSTAATLTGNELANSLIGNSGNDTLLGLAGNDTLDGGAGADTLTVGSGSDVVRFDTLLNALTNVDTITDYSVVDDTCQLENSIFAALTTTGTLAAACFVAGSAALDANDYVIYSSASGALYYDADGSGAGSAVQFAMLGAGLALTNADFLVT